LHVTGTLQFVGAPDAQPRDGLGGVLYRVRARLKSGLTSLNQIVHCGGVWLNGVWARQGVSMQRESLGISTGLPDQTFALPVVRGTAGAAVSAAMSAEVPVVANGVDFERALDAPLVGVPILGDEIVEVREWAGRGDDWQTALAGVDLARVRFEWDPQDPSIKTAAWVRWQARPHLFASGPGDRHYVVERARGVFTFAGPGGFAPPAGAPIVVSYVTGGGVIGNAPAGAVRELRSGVGFVQSVSNPFAAAGGAGAESLRAARDRGAQQVRHRDRAVSFEDYEWLAMAASSEVARVRALPLESAAGRGARGFVGLVLVPHSADAMPTASPELCRRVIDSLATRVPAGIAGGLRIVAPSYVPVGVRAEILPLRAEESGRVEARVRARLAKFLHPLSGGAAGRGWRFGEGVYLSDLAALIEATEGVDAVRFLQLMVGQRVYLDEVPLEPGQLVAAGDSQLKIIVPSIPYALA
jgi:baseplate J-like protein